MEDESGYQPREYPNIRGLVGVLIANRVATLYELQTIYSLEDAMDMYEAIAVPKYNEWKSYQIESQKK